MGKIKTFISKRFQQKYVQNEYIVGELENLNLDSIEEKKMQLEKEKQNKKLEDKSRRWGETKKIFEESKNLKPIKKNDLIIINKESDSPFLNRFNLICESFFYPLMRENNQKANYFKKNKTLLAEFISFLTTVLENASSISYLMKVKCYIGNSHKFYYMVEECLDFLISVNDYSVMIVNRSKMQCLLKITIFVKQEIIYKYPLVISNLMTLYKDLLSEFFFYSDDLYIF